MKIIGSRQYKRKVWASLRADSGGQDWDLHGEADAGAQKAAAARRTAKAAAETFMVPVGRGCGRSCAVLRSFVGILCSSGWPFIASQASRGGAPKGSFQNSSQALADIIRDIALNRKEN